MNLFQSLVLSDKIDSTNQFLSRIADALERISPPIDPKRLEVSRMRGPGDIIRYGDNNKQWLKEEFTTLVRERGLSPSQEKEALDELMGLAESTELE